MLLGRREERISFYAVLSDGTEIICGGMEDK